MAGDVVVEKGRHREAADNGELRQRVRGALSRLSPRDQDIVRLYYFEDLSLKEIGRVLGVTESRVSQLLTRVRGQLQEALAEVVELAA